jgi:hypothetical protein
MRTNLIIFRAKEVFVLYVNPSAFKFYLGWKSKPKNGGPKTDREVTDLINQMANENPLWRLCFFKTSSVLKMTKFCSN